MMHALNLRGMPRSVEARQEEAGNTVYFRPCVSLYSEHADGQEFPARLKIHALQQENGPRTSSWRDQDTLWRMLPR
jgi:hypothetical protein